MTIAQEENMVAFSKHLREEESIYGPVTIVNLVEKNGKEKVLGDAYLDAVIRYNSPSISYFSFDFHEWWYVKHYALCSNSDYYLI